MKNVRKRVALILMCALVLLSLTACGGNAEIQKRVQELETELQEANQRINALENSASNTMPESKNNFVGLVETEQLGAKEEITAEQLQYLDNQIASEVEINWTEAAKCEYIPADRLEILALKCANYQNKSKQVERLFPEGFADVISKNPNTTDTAMRTLATSENPAVWLVVAQSDKSERALKDVAERCANMDYYRGDSKNREMAEQIAKAILENPNRTQEYIQPLSTSKFSSVVKLGQDVMETMAG